MTFKPLLSYTIEDTSKIKYPAYASYKLDGIRAVVIDSVVYSRSMKPIRSKAVQELFGVPEYEGFDGELLYGDFNAENVFNLTTQAVMSTELKPEFSREKISFAVFDDIAIDGRYSDRYDSIIHRILGSNCKGTIGFLRQNWIENEEELLAFEKEALELGYEGIMVRSIDGIYKQGRSTQKDGIIGKLKRFTDDEALIIGFEEKMINTNEKKMNETGYSQRSQSKEGLVPAGTLGAFICTCKGITFTMGSGLNDEQRDEIWNNKEKYLGKLAKFKHFLIGQKDSYRFPIFKGIRDKDDLCSTS